MLSLEQQRNIIYDCINGNGIRDCGRCDAYHTRGGVCCFARKYEPGDGDCTRCRHKTECERLSHSYQPPPRPVWNPGYHNSATHYPPARHIAPNAAVQKPTGPFSQPQPIVQVQPKLPGTHSFLAPAGPRKDEKYPKFVTRVAVHGALEGALTFVLQLLQLRRPF